MRADPRKRAPRPLFRKSWRLNPLLPTVSRKLVWALGWLAFGLTRAAQAAEGDVRLGGNLGAGWLEGFGWGPSLSAHAELGLTEMLSASLGARASLHGSRPVRASEGSIGLKARFDVLRWVPYAQMSVGVCRCGAASADARNLSSDYTVSLLAGIEYLLSRDLSAQLGGAYSQVGNDDWAPWLVISGGFVWHPW